MSQLVSYGSPSTVLSLTGDIGGAISPVAGNINLLGGNNISTVGTPGTMTVNVSGTTDHALQVGNATGSLTSLGLGTATYVLTSNGAGVDPSWQSAVGNNTTFHTDGADAVEAADAITFAGGNNITTSGAGSTVTIDLDGTTDHSLQLGNASGSITSLGAATDGQIPIGSTGADPVLANITSAGAYLDITNGAGSIEIDVSDNAKSTAIHSWNGCFINGVRGVVSESGGVVSVAIDRAGGGDLEIILSSGFYDWDTTPAVSVNLTAGTDTSPQLNYVYFDQPTSALVASTAGWPATEHAPIGRMLIPSAALVATDGPYMLHQQSTETYDATSNMGHMAHISEWIRAQNATWESGVAQTLTITVNAGAKDNVIFSSTSGVVMQLHDKDFPAFAGGEYFVVNDSVTAYKKITDLNSIDTDSDGNTLVDRYFTIVIWGSSSGNGTSEKLFVNLPAGSYSSANYAKKDARKEANYSIPSEFKGVGFLIAAYVLRYSSAASGTWTNVLFTDLRGLYPSITAGGSTDYPSEFSDDVFRINDDTDPTKQLAFQVSPVTTATTRTITMCDADLDLTSPSFGGSVTAATGLTVTDNDVTISSGKLVLPTTTADDGQITINGNRFMHAYGSNNVFLGSDSGNLSLSGSYNIGIGSYALDALTSGYHNVGVGYRTLSNTTYGYDNTAVGYNAGYGSSADSRWNVYVGSGVAATASNNGHADLTVAIGFEAMKKSSQNSGYNVFIGPYAATSINGAHLANTVIGAYAFDAAVGLGYPSSDTPHNNTIIGYSAASNIAGNRITSNTIIGSGAGSAYTTTESHNILLGSAGVAAESNVIRIGTQGTGTGQQDTAFMAGIYNTAPSGGADNVVVIDSNGQLGAQATLDVANGGTGAATLTDHGVLIGSGTGAISVTAVGTADQVLTSNGAGLDPTFQDAASPLITLNEQTTTAYTLILSDASKLVTCSNASAITLTVPPNSSVAFSTGTQIMIEQKGAGTVTVTAGSGVTIRSADSLLDTYAQYSLVSIIKVDTDVWLLSGDLG